MKVFGVILIIISLLIGVLVDIDTFIDVRFPVFSSFVIFLTAIYILSVKKSS